MAGFTFCCGDFGPAMEAKGTVTNEICEMVEDDPRVCYINSDGTSTGGRVQQLQARFPDHFANFIGYGTLGFHRRTKVTTAKSKACHKITPPPVSQQYIL